MKKIEFTKVVASGNDFIIISRLPFTANRLPSLAKNVCDRKYGVGADGLLVLEKSRTADIKMRIFNADGSEAQMCGNGARCVALYYSRKSPACRQAGQIACLSGRQANRKRNIMIETKAGIVEGRVSGNNVRIKLTEPRDYQPGVAIKIQERQLRIHSLNTGVPHAVIFVEGIEDIDVSDIGRQIRYYESFAPAGTNVDFVEVIDKNTIKVRTYERGVEDETLACGTGAAASAVVASYQSQVTGHRSQVISHKEKINVITQGGETLKVYFDRENEKINNVWLEGKAEIIYKGEYYV